jgi:hypothetical protein
MIIQWYNEEKMARIFNQHIMICEMRSNISPYGVDLDLKALGLRRRNRWEKTDWGYEAKLRKQ